MPVECGGCGAPATRWCPACAAELTVRPDEPHVVTPREDPGVPVFALGRYAGARRRAVVGLKEHGRTDLVAPLADAVAAALRTLITWGLIVPPLTVVPAPTRSLAARRRATRRHRRDRAARRQPWGRSKGDDCLPPGVLRLLHSAYLRQ